MNRSQARSQVVTVWGYLTPHVGLGEVGQSLPGGLLVRGGAGRALRAAATFRLSPIGDEPHRGARNRVDHTGGGRGLGPGLPAFALGRPVSPSHSPARFALKWEVPPSTISTSLTLRLCQHGRTRAALQGGSLLGPGAQILKPRA